MKSAFLIFALSSFFTLAHAAQVFKCTDGFRTFAVEKNTDGEFFGMFQENLGTPKRFECIHTRPGNNYNCTSEKDTMVVRRAYSGLMMVEVNDSGYTAAMYCEN